MGSLLVLVEVLGGGGGVGFGGGGGGIEDGIDGEFVGVGSVVGSVRMGEGGMGV